MLRDKTVVVIGLGVIGLPTALMLAFEGFKVVGIDSDQDKINRLRHKDLSDVGNSFLNLLSRDDSYPNFVCSIIDTPDHVDYVVVCTGVSVGDDHRPIFEPFDFLVKEIAEYLIGDGTTVCFETTLSPGTMLNRVKPLLEQFSGKKCGTDFYLVHAPERITIERLVYNMWNMPRVVGGYTDTCREKGKELYRSICKTINTTDLTTAEITKLTENTYRDVNIAFANEVAAICDNYKVDFLEVRNLVNSLPNVPGNEYINPQRNLHLAGSGVGGYCLPKDPWLLNEGRPSILSGSVIAEARKVNDRTPRYLALKVEKILLESNWAQNGNGFNVLLLGFSAIRNTSDCRNTPAEKLIDALAESLLINTVFIYDPHVPEWSTSDIADQVSRSAVIVLVTPHSEFDSLFNSEFMKRLKSERVVLRTGNVLKNGKLF